MKTIIAGSRSIPAEMVAMAVEVCPWKITEVVCGCCEGPDRGGEAYARAVGVPVIFFPAWDHQLKWALEHRQPGELVRYREFAYRGGNRAGFKRNANMSAYGEAFLGLWDGASGGTKDMIFTAQMAALRVYVWTPAE